MGVNPDILALNKMRQKARTTKVCWLLMGMLGIHNFVAGKPLYAIVYLVLGGLFLYNGSMAIATFFNLILAHSPSPAMENLYIEYLARAGGFFAVITFFWISDFFTVIRPLEKACQEEERRLSL